MWRGGLFLISFAPIAGLFRSAETGEVLFCGFSDGFLYPLLALRLIVRLQATEWICVQKLKEMLFGRVSVLWLPVFPHHLFGVANRSPVILFVGSVFLWFFETGAGTCWRFTWPLSWRCSFVFQLFGRSLGKAGFRSLVSLVVGLIFCLSYAFRFECFLL